MNDKIVKGAVSLGIFYSEFWEVDIVVGAGVHIDYIFTVVIDDYSRFSYSDVFFDGLNDL